MSNTTNNEEIETAEDRYRNIGQDLVDARVELQMAFEGSEAELEEAILKYTELKAKYAAAKYLAERA